MSDDVVIRVEGLGKKYVIGHEAERERYVALRDVIARGVRNAGRMAADMLRGRTVVAGDSVEEFWALKDVSFEVKRGEVLGIIGRNGAGKSTLLKILSRITEPTEGRVRLKGRVASLLEVGTGFHPELTGRENVYLNGAILGMKHAEIKRKFDEIVAFAEVEKFLDTPVKRYSSGMYVRLAFAVAAHLEPEILIVDEVLAVGDAEFQKKCLGKMQDVAGQGRTVLFVSHNMAAITALCSKGLLLSRGIVSSVGETEAIIRNYVMQMKGNFELKGKKVDLRVAIGTINSVCGEKISIEFEFTLRGPLEEPRIGIGINNAHGTRVATIFSETAQKLLPIEKNRSRQVKIVIAPTPLMPGPVFVKVALAERGTDIEVYEDAIYLVIPEYFPFKLPAYTRPSGTVYLPIQALEQSCEQSN